jgi:hypothetical protein
MASDSVMAARMQNEMLGSAMKRLRKLGLKKSQIAWASETTKEDVKARLLELELARTRR